MLDDKYSDIPYTNLRGNHIMPIAIDQARVQDVRDNFGPSAPQMYSPSRGGYPADHYRMGEMRRNEFPSSRYPPQEKQPSPYNRGMNRSFVDPNQQCLDCGPNCKEAPMDRYPNPNDRGKKFFIPNVLK